MISENEFVNLINEKSDFLINENDENQFEVISVPAFEVMFTKDFVVEKTSLR